MYETGTLVDGVPLPVEIAANVRHVQVRVGGSIPVEVKTFMLDDGANVDAGEDTIPSMQDETRIIDIFACKNLVLTATGGAATFRVVGYDT